MTTINLENRVARCTCGREEPSSQSLPFFEYRGEGSTVATTSCKTCRYRKVAHERAVNDPAATHLHHIIVGHDFEPVGGFDHDSFYCGCRGWD